MQFIIDKKYVIFKSFTKDVKLLDQKITGIPLKRVERNINIVNDY